MILEGNTILELAREKKINNRVKREIVHRIEKHNTITNYAKNAIGKGNFCDSIPNTVIFPYSQWYNGCVLTSEENDASLGMIANNSEIIACAGSTSDSGSTDMRRGSFNTNESGDITGGRRFVWDWATDRGNGTIKSVGLTRAALAISEISQTSLPSANPITSLIYSTGGLSTDYLAIGRMQIIDYEKEVGYFVSYDSGIKVVEYPLSTKTVHLLDRVYKPRLAYDGSVVSTTHSIPDSTISNPNADSDHSSISYTGSHIHWVTWSGSVIKDYVVNTETWELDSNYGTDGIITRTFSGVSFTDTYRNANWNYHVKKDVCPIIGNYIWMMGTVSSVSKILKCNLLGSQATEIFEYDNPFHTAGVSVGDTRINGCCCILPNGDFIKSASSSSYISNDLNPALYFHNNKFYMTRINGFASSSATTDSSYITGMNANAYGTMLIGNVFRWETGLERLLFPHGFLSTVNNLEEAVTKSADLTMKLTYSITETSS